MDRGRAAVRLAVVAFMAACLVSPALAPPARAADPVSFGAPAATATWGQGVTFSQPVTPGVPVDRAEILITTPGGYGPLVEEVDPPACCGSSTLSWDVKESDGHIVPNTPFSAQWRLRVTGGHSVLGPTISVTYTDTRFDWQTVTGKIVRVHWSTGSLDFGSRALAIGDAAVQQAATLLGVTETQPVDFFVYADQQSFYDALGPGTRENVGGEAHPEIRTMFALITPDEIDAAWVSQVVPHELTHLVFDTATRNPYHEPPRWLNEGLAVYLSEGYSSDWRAIVSDALGARSIVPLDGLTAGFPTGADQMYLAYGESVSAIDFLVRKYGKESLVRLVRSYATGVTDDEAFKAALGVDVTGFQAAWLSDLGTPAVKAVGPRPAPTGPVPSGWAGGYVVTGQGGSAGGSTEPPAGGDSGSGGPQGSSTDTVIAAAIAAGLGLVVVGGIVIGGRRRRGGDA